jgi:hypothetical protein
MSELCIVELELARDNERRGGGEEGQDKKWEWDGLWRQQMMMSSPEIV